MEKNSILNIEVNMLQLKQHMKQPVYRTLYYSTFIQYVQEFMHYFLEMALKATASVNTADFWWTKDTIKVLSKATEKEDKFLDEYAEELFNTLHKNIEQGYFDSIICIDLQKEKVKGYKFYKKTDGIWRGIQYIKAER